MNLDFNYPQDQDAANTNIDITAVIPNADPKNYFYIMHVVCVESEITSSLLDLNAPGETGRRAYRIRHHKQ